MNVKLRWGDAGATLLVIAGLAMALSVTQRWGWPLLGSPRAGIIAIGVVGHGALMGISMRENESSRSATPFLVIRTLLAVVAAFAAIAGLIVGTQEYLVLLMVATVVMWFVIMVRHALEGSTAAPTPTASH